MSGENIEVQHRCQCADYQTKESTPGRSAEDATWCGVASRPLQHWHALNYVAHDLLDRLAFDLRLGPQNQAMPEHGQCHRLHVFMREIRSTFE